MGASAQPNSGTSEVHCIQIAVHGRAPPILDKQYWLCYFSRGIEASQRSLHNAPIFRLLLKVAVNGTHQCDFLNFCGASGSNCTQHGSLVSPALALPIPCKLSLLLPILPSASFRRLLLVRGLSFFSTQCFPFSFPARILPAPSAPPNQSPPRPFRSTRSTGALVPHAELSASSRVVPNATKLGL